VVCPAPAPTARCSFVPCSNFTVQSGLWSSSPKSCCFDSSRLGHPAAQYLRARTCSRPPVLEPTQSTQSTVECMHTDKCPPVRCHSDGADLQQRLTTTTVTRPTLPSFPLRPGTRLTATQAYE
jgi:hypothetical protein